MHVMMPLDIAILIDDVVCADRPGASGMAAAEAHGAPTVQRYGAATKAVAGGGTAVHGLPADSSTTRGSLHGFVKQHRRKLHRCFPINISLVLQM